MVWQEYHFLTISRVPIHSEKAYTFQYFLILENLQLLIVSLKIFGICELLVPQIRSWHQNCGMMAYHILLASCHRKAKIWPFTMIRYPFHLFDVLEREEVEPLMVWNCKSRTEIFAFAGSVFMDN